jgi:hypothetical protein
VLETLNPTACIVTRLMTGSCGSAAAPAKPLRDLRDQMLRDSSKARLRNDYFFFGR